MNLNYSLLVGRYLPTNYALAATYGNYVPGPEPSVTSNGDGSIAFITSVIFIGILIWAWRASRGSKKKADRKAVEQQRHQSSMQSASTSIAKPETQPIGSVYLLKAGPFYKIGKSINFEKRLKQIKLQLPYPVEVVHTISTPEHSKLEAYWHQRFRSKRTNGEWFLLTDEDVEEFVGYLGPSQEGL